MPRQYTAKYRQFAIERLIANDGSIARTSEELGIPDRTLLRWRQKAGIPSAPPPPPTSLSGDSKSLSVYGEGFREGLPADELQNFRDIQAGMLQNVKLLNTSVAEAIEEAPLIQRVTALIQLTDRIIKLAAQLPQPEEEVEIRYVLSDDVEPGDDEDNYPDN